MKTSICLSFLLIITSMVTISGQEINPSVKSPWSVSLSFAPKIGFDLTGINISYPNESYLFSLDVRAEHKLFNKFSYSFGINFNKNKSSVYEIVFDGAGSRYKGDSYLIQFPFQINYHFLNHVKILDPYAKISLRNSFLKLNANGTIGAEPFHDDSYDYVLLFDLGFGNNFKLNKNLSIIFESCFGYGLVYLRKNLGYYEGTIGLRYTFK